MIPKSSFARNVLAVASGTVVAQAIPVVASPVLTRLYEPSEFGLLALYLSLVAVGAVAATGRYEIAILIPADNEDARSLTQLSLAVTAASAVVFLIVAIPVSMGWISIPSWKPLGGRLLLVPVGIWLSASAQSLWYWLSRHTQFATLARSRIAQSATMLGTQLAVGLLRPFAGTLILGHLGGQAASVATQWWRSRHSDSLQLLPVDGARIRRVAVTFREYPTFLVVGHLANVISSQLPVLMLATLFSPTVAGLYALAERVLVLPSSVIGSAIGDVYRQQAAKQYQEFGNCRELYLRTLRQLAVLSIVPCLTVVWFGAPLFGWVFGAEWMASGTLASILAGMIFFQMISSPLSQTVYLGGMHRLDTVWQFGRLGVSAAALIVGARMSPRAELAVLLYAAAFAAMHIVHSIMQYHAARGRAIRTV